MSSLEIFNERVCVCVCVCEYERYVKIVACVSIKD